MRLHFPQYGNGLAIGLLLVLLTACGGGGGGGGGGPQPPAPPAPPAPPTSGFPPVLDPTNQTTGSLYAVTSRGRIVTFNRGANAFSTGAVITGMVSDNRVVGVEVRLSDSSVIALGDRGGIYSVNPRTGGTTLLGQTSAMPQGTQFGIELLTSPEQLRVVTNTGFNITTFGFDESVNPPPFGTFGPLLEPLPAGISEIAGTQNLVPCGDPSVLYLLDTTNDRLLVERRSQGQSQLVPVGALGVDAENASGFEILQNADRSDAAIAVLRVAGDSSLYDIDLSTGRATLAAPVAGLAQDEAIVGLAGLPPAQSVVPRVGDMIGVTQSGKLISFDDKMPQVLCVPATPIVGLVGSEQIVDVDLRPADGKVYALTDANRVYTVSTSLPTFGQATVKATLQADPSDTDNPFQGPITQAVSTDFDPRRDKLNAVQANGTVLAIDVDSGLVSTPGFPTVPPNSTLAFHDSYGPSPDPTRVAKSPIFAQSDPVFTRTDIRGSDGTLYTINLSADRGSSILTAEAPPLGSRGVINRRIAGGEPLRGIAYIRLEQATVHAVTTSNHLLSFKPTTPSQLDSDLTITGLQPNEQVLAIDLRLADDLVYGLTDQARLYTLDLQSGAATFRTTLRAAGGDDNPFTGLDGSNVDIDFSPFTGQLRVVSEHGQNLRVNILTGDTITDPNITVIDRPRTPAIAGSAYIFAGTDANNPANLTAIDVANDRLVGATQINGTTVSFRDLGALGIDAQDVLGLDQSPTGFLSYALLTTPDANAALYSFDSFVFQSRRLQLAGNISLPTPATDQIRGLTLAITNPAVSNDGPLYTILNGRSLLSFQPSTPNQTTVLTLNDLPVGEQLLSIDYRINDRQLFGLSSAGNIYAINLTNGNATLLLTGAPLRGSRFEMDFNPLLPTNVGELTIISDAGQALFVNLGNSTVQERTIDYGTPATASVAYSSNIPSALRGTQFILDTAAASLHLAGSLVNLFFLERSDEVVDGSTSFVGALNPLGNPAVFAPMAPLDVAGGSDGLVLAALRRVGATQSSLSYISPTLTDGTQQVGTIGPLTPIGAIGTPPIRGLTIRIK